MIFPPQLRRFLKCQGLGHLATDYPNIKIITLAEWQAAREVESEEKIEQKNGDVFEETLEEILVEANKGDMLTLNTHNPPRSHEHLSLPTTFYEPQALSPIPPTPKTLNKNFCQSI